MQIKARPFGYHKQFDWGADIPSVSYSGQLVIRVLRNRNKDDGIEVRFSRVGGFRLLMKFHLLNTGLMRTFHRVTLCLGYLMVDGQRKKTCG
jgi:hypothetical protein